MPTVYQQTLEAASPLILADMKAYLRISSSADDDLIQSLIDACTCWGEKYTGRDFRANEYDLLLDCFTDPIKLRRDPVAAVDEITHLVSDSPVTVSSAIYYLVKDVQNSWVYLIDGESWPTDTDNRLQAITVSFTMEASDDLFCLDEILTALKRHVAWMYSNRGDCQCTLDESANDSGVTFIYDQFRIARC
jgi:uncharacterized phiE125 gp8 family phage protein